MTDKEPTSFKVFIGTLSTTAIVLTTATLFSFYHVDKKYAMILALLQFIALAFTTVGVYAGIKYRTENRRHKLFNKVGLIGNLLIFLFTVGIMTFAVVGNTHH